MRKRMGLATARRMIQLIRAEMANQGMSSARMTKLLDVTPQYVNRILNARTGISFATADRLASVLGMQWAVQLEETDQNA